MSGLGLIAGQAAFVAAAYARMWAKARNEKRRVVDTNGWQAVRHHPDSVAACEGGVCLLFA